MRALFYSFGALILLCVLLFFAATRTQVGREALGRQLEAQFSLSYYGTLDIGTLKGNLRQQVFLSDVHFRDEQGHLWLSVDSIVATPRWNSLWHQRFEVRSVKLLGPTLHLRLDPQNPRRAARLLRRRSRPVGAAWTFASAGLSVENGAVRGIHSLPEGNAGWMHALLTADLDDVHAEARIAWGAEGRHLSLEKLEATVLDQGLAVHGLRFELDASTDSTYVRNLSLGLGESHIRAPSAALSTSDEVSGVSFVWHAVLEESVLDFSELQRLFPRLPPGPRLRIASRLRGTDDTIEIASASLEWGNTQVRSSGTVRGLPDSAAFDLRLRPSTIAPPDLAALFPESGLPSWIVESGVTSLEGGTSGVASRGNLQMVSSVQGRALEGTFLLSTRLGGSAREGWTYLVDAQIDSVGTPSLATKLSGTATLEGSGTSLDRLDASFSCALERSIIAGHAVDWLRVNGTVKNQEVALSARAARAEESAALIAVGRWSDANPRYDVNLEVANLNIGPVLSLDAVTTAITGRLDIGTRGLGWDSLHGSMGARIESAILMKGTEVWELPWHQISMTANPSDSPLPRLVVSGNLLSAAISGNTEVHVLEALTSLWKTALHSTMERQAQKKVAFANHRSELPALPWPPPNQIVQQDHVRAKLQEAGLGHVALDIDLQVKAAPWLSAWLHLFPAVPDAVLRALRISANAAESQHTAALSVAASADTIRLQGYAEERSGPRVEFDIAAGLQLPLEETLDATILVEAPKAAYRGVELIEPRITARILQGVARVNTRTEVDNRVGPATIDATIEMLEDRFRVLLDAGRITVAGQPWQLTSGRVVDVYWDAVVFEDLTLAQPGSLPQYVRLSGTLSDAPSRGVTADLVGLQIRELSNMLELRRTFSGTLNGRLQWSPDVGLLGHAAVDTLRMGDRVLGRLEAHSHYMPGRPDVSIEAKVHPVVLPDSFVGREAQNDIKVTGAMRRGSESGPGSLNLALEVVRLDAFILEELINILGNVEGSFEGRGSVTGTLDYPIFEADLAIDDLQFEMPLYDLAYTAAASVQIDQTGVHLRDLSIADSTGGSADIFGSLLFNDYRFLSFDVAGSLDELQIMNVPGFTRELSWYGAIWASGDATLTGPLDNAFLRSENVVTSPRSELYIPIREQRSTVDPGFIVYRDPGEFSPLEPVIRKRANILDRRPATERQFGAGLEIDLNIEAPEGSTIKLVIDPLLGDVITGNGTARIQLQLHEGNFATYGTFDVASGDYLFTAGEVFVRRFLIQDGIIQWTGDPLDPTLDIHAEYRTRASRGGLPEDVGGALRTSLPLIVELHITGELNAVQVGLSLVLDQRQEAISDTPLLEAYLNQPDRAAQHATSVLLTNSFLLSAEGSRNDLLAGSALNSVSQLATSQLNRYLSHVIPNADFALGVLSDETAEELDVSAGIALRLLDERLLIRGQGIYRGQQADVVGAQGLEGEFVVELRLSPTLSVDLFYRREGDVLSETLVTSETGVGLNYRTQFSTWRGLWDSVFQSGAQAPDSVTVSSQ